MGNFDVLRCYKVLQSFTYWCPPLGTIIPTPRFARAQEQAQKLTLRRSAMGKVATFTALFLIVQAASAYGVWSQPRESGVVGARDHRVPVEPDRWPWSSIGRINRQGSGFCTATLIGPRQVVTAAHCLYDRRRQRWVKPDEIHFLAGYARGEFRAHAVGASFVHAPGRSSNQPPESSDLTRDWVIVVLRDSVPLKPIKWRALTAEGLAPAVAQGKLVRAGYGRDRAHLLSMHQDCTIAGTAQGGSVVLHRCDSVHGDSGSPLLLFLEGEPVIVGIHVAIVMKGGERLGAAIPSRTFDESAQRAMRSN